ncbi:hypothetical protein ABIE76_002197 [Sinorhizobium fredii]
MSQVSARHVASVCRKLDDLASAAASAPDDRKAE